MKNGFSLVELSIVLVILGLLTGGILAGQNLIRASELRSVTTQRDQVISAVHTFRDKYFALPGDMRNATNFWGAAHATATTCLTTISSDGSTCDGDGDGRLISTSTSHEGFRFWQQLANAGLTEGNYTGVADGSTSYSATTANSLRGKLNNAIWFIWNWDAFNGIGNSPTVAAIPAYNNYMHLGRQTANSGPAGDVVSAEESWNIDTKVDDGRPGYGGVIAYPYFNAACTDASAVTDLDSEYALSATSKSCGILFVDLW